MRKTILMGLGLAAALAGTAVAQQGGEAPRRSREQGGRPERFDKRGGGPDGFLLRGITLTDAQKTQLEQLRKSDREKMQANRATAQKQHDEVRAARVRGDTVEARALAQRQRQATEQARDQHVGAVRALLTAEQRAQFDRNVAEMKQRQAERGEKLGPGRGDRPGKRPARDGR